MSHRSTAIRERNKLTAVPSFQNKQRPPQVRLETLIALLVSQGMQPGYKVQFSKEGQCVRLAVTCGPIEIPLDFGPEGARIVGAGLITAADTVEAPEEKAAEETALKGDYDDDVDEDLTYTVAAEAVADSPCDTTDAELGATPSS